MALTIIDGSEFKGNRLKVEKAKFEMKGGKLAVPAFLFMLCKATSSVTMETKEKRQCE